MPQGYRATFASVDGAGTGTRKWISPESQRNVVNAAAAWIERQ